MSRHTTIVLAGLLAGCGESAPPRPIADVSLSISTGEYDGSHSWLVVGQTGYARVEATSDECVYQPPCDLFVDVEVTSSDPDLLAPDRRVVESPGDVALLAKAPGTVMITAMAGSVSDVDSVTVVGAPLPVDEVRVHLQQDWSDLPAEYDALGSLRSVTVPVGESGALTVNAIRNGVIVYGIPIEVASSAPEVGLPTVACRPEDLDPTCELLRPAWITGRSPGDASITITVRNVSRTFTAHVVTP